MSLLEKIFGFGVILLIFASGCSDYNPADIRAEHVQAYSREITEQTILNLSAKKSLGLEDCIRIALDNNLDIKTAQLEKKISKLNKDIAFSYFLPTVSLGYNYTQFSPLPKMKFGNASVAMSDNNVSQVNWQIQLSVFNPATWYMYDLNKRGQDISNLVYEYTRQMIVFEVTYLYYNCLSLEEGFTALSSYVDAAVELENKIEAFYNEGMASQAQLKDAGVMVKASRIRLEQNWHSLGQMKGELLRAMGLSPLGELILSLETPFVEPAGDMAQLVTEALYSNKQLFISDAQVAIEKEKVKIASTAFLPILGGFVQNTWSSDALMAYESYWTMGLSGVLTVFDGFKNVNQYKIAKENKKKAYIAREQQTLRIILEVIKAKYNLEDIKNYDELSKAAYDAACETYRQASEKFAEGLIDASSMLAAAAQKDQANMEMLNVNFQRQLSIATLINVMGKTETELQEGDNGSYFENN